MKTRFTTLDIIAELSELQHLVGMRVNQVYDVDNKTYLFRLNRPVDEKAVLLIESGSRIHTTAFEWPKSPAPSGFSMKLRKHINNKRLESIKQLGIDRVIDLQFGSNEAAYHVLLELYDRGNIVLTDHEYKIMNILRPRVQGEEKFLVKETYPIELAKQSFEPLSSERIKELVGKAKPNDNLKKVFTPYFEYGPALLEHLLSLNGLAGNVKVKDFGDRFEAVHNVFQTAEEFVRTMKCNGVIVQKPDMRPTADGEMEEFYTYIEFHPLMLKQLEEKPTKEFEKFDSAIDEFFSKIESQKIDLKAVQQEKQAMKKLENVKKDHMVRIEKLQQDQEVDRRKGELIEFNNKLVDKALTVIRSALANQIDWKEIDELIKEATENGDPVASTIKQLKLESNHFVMLLKDPYAHLDYDDSEEEDETKMASEMLVDIDIDLSAQANARRFYTQKKSAAVKEKKTVESASTALKSAERKTKQTLKEVAAITNINKARKVFWFEKFFWFISSENYLVIAGRDMQQNELIVKRYMRPGDIYVHADLHGASSVVIKNPSGQPVPPKTLNEAGHMAVCYSVAWDSKVLTSAWWVESSQVSKSAPTGEYLTAGSFMIRGKKNYLTPASLILGFGFLFKLEESSIERHKDERKVRVQDEMIISDVESVADSVKELEIDVEEGESSDEEEKKSGGLEEIKEEGKDELENKDDLDKDEDVKEDEESKDDKVDEHDETASEDEEEKEKESPREDSEGKEEVVEFPDVSVDVDYSNTGEIKFVARSTSQNETKEDFHFSEKGNKGRKKKTGGGDGSKKGEATQEQKKENQQPKRGKKGKMKKIKEKYKDQDEEEKELRMQLLQGKQREKKKDKKKSEKESKIEATQQRKKNPPKPREQRPNEEEEEDKVVPAEVDMLDSLTGIPLSEDEILFAVPIVAPYNTMTNYKFKVKVTPGTGKRGKATKTALNMFLMDKSTLQREKDLLKSVKDQDLARNLPGKVKLSAPQLHKAKNKKK